MKLYEGTGLVASVINYGQISFDTRIMFLKNIIRVKHKIPI